MYSSGLASCGPKRGSSFTFGPNENKVRTRPERCGNAAAGPGRKNDVVVLGRLETFDHGWQGLRLGNRQMGQKPVDIGSPAVALRDEGNLRVLLAAKCQLSEAASAIAFS